ncbi:hypothetical protein BHE74_00000253 [Ensete ventricosum]|nr:hypothetical protein BHE74_00000253 [Ensete ventricosum]RZR77839.1 hypothetical protein BHM03_00003039 [Ensete ventricosum]
MHQKREKKDQVQAKREGVIFTYLFRAKGKLRSIDLEKKRSFSCRKVKGRSASWSSFLLKAACRRLAYLPGRGTADALCYSLSARRYTLLVVREGSVSFSNSIIPSIEFKSSPGLNYRIEIGIVSPKAGKDSFDVSSGRL